MAQMALLPGATTFPDPGNWNAADNMVEVIGPGNSARFSNTTGAGYAFDVNLDPTFPVPVSILLAAQIASQNQSTCWGTASSAPPAVPGNVRAGCGNTGPYYPAAGSIPGGPNNPNGIGGTVGLGGCGASGPNGRGGSSNGTGNDPPSAGGDGNGGLTPAQTTLGANGLSVVPSTWTAVNIGIGGGGAGGGAGQAGGNGGFPGGAGAYAGTGGSSANTQPGLGVIIVTWAAPVVPPAGMGQVIG